MVPDASARLYQLMIELSRSEFGAVENHQYPEIVIDSVPVPEFFSNTRKAEEATFMLKDRVRKLNYLLPGCFGLACNTAHTTLVDLEQETSVLFISIASEAAKKKQSRRVIGKSVYWLRPRRFFSGVYQTEFLDKKIEVVLPDNGYIEELGEIIGQIVGGGNLNSQKRGC